MVIVRWNDLVRPEDLATDPDDPLVVFNPDGSNVHEASGKLWAMVMLMVLRDNATSVHYHPWLEDGGLAYVIKNTRTVIEPPPAQYASVCIDVARTLFTPPKPRRFFSRF